MYGTWTTIYPVSGNVDMPSMIQAFEQLTVAVVISATLTDREFRVNWRKPKYKIRRIVQRCKLM